MLIVYLRSLLVVLLFFPLYTVVLSIIGVSYKILTGRREWIEWAGKTWGRWTLWFFGVEVEVQGAENLPEKEGCLLLFNHTSFMDIFVITALVDRIKFGAKIELFSIPFFGSAMRAAGVLPIARENREETIRIYQEAEARAHQGEKFALSPEGTRNSVEKLLPFKSGPFIFAIRAKMPVVPVVIQGASQIWPKGTLVPALNSWKSKIQIKFLPKVESSNYSIDSRSEFSKKVREQMEPYFL